MKKPLLAMFAFSLIFAFTIMQTHAQEVRHIQPIKSPTVTDVPLGEGVQPVKEPIPVDRQTVEKTMQTIAEKWNSPDMAKILDKNFYEKDRLMDSMYAKAPVDAKLRIMSVGSYRVINQGIKLDPAGDLLISRVSVIAKTQVEYNDPQNGFQRRQGEQEYIIKITQRGASR
ncbi:MAG: hypothetical protein EHM12_11625 [Dehalococcoidia bacterium]|nr:MAG: hypothetical protein EHM12_11625 [Dehalococcoidia bacterium]